ncbi:MAG: insulinase family protein [Syntrophales bacterium]|nr:insulinase family protein [Syntrophales bacterium]
MNLRHLGSLVLLLALTTSSALAQDLSLDKRIHSFELKNGLKVLILERHISPTVALYLAYRVGAVDEQEGKTGTAHFLEHMMFKGTKTIGTRNQAKEERLLNKILKTGKRLDQEINRGEKADKEKIEALKRTLAHLKKEHRKWMISNEIDRLYTEAGAININASTGQDITIYHASFPANKIELWMRVESERMKEVVLREFYEERNVVLEERKQRKEANPQGALYEAFMSLAFQRHHYRRPIIGWAEDVARLQPEDLISFKRKLYVPNNATIAIVGDVDAKKTLKMVKTYFGAIPRAYLQTPPIPDEPVLKGEKRISLDVKASPQIMIGYHKPPAPHPDDYVFDLIESILSRGRSARLPKRLVDEKAIALSVEAQNGLPGSRFNNLFIIFGRPRDGKTNAELMAYIDEILEELKNREIDDQELEAAKNNIVADFVRLQESNEGMARMLAYNQAIIGDYRYTFTYLGRIKEITPADIRRVAQKYLIKNGRVIATID